MTDESLPSVVLVPGVQVDAVKDTPLTPPAAQFVTAVSVPAALLAPPPGAQTVLVNDAPAAPPTAHELTTALVPVAVVVPGTHTDAT